VITDRNLFVPAKINPWFKDTYLIYASIYADLRGFSWFLGIKNKLVILNICFNISLVFGGWFRGVVSKS